MRTPKAPALWPGFFFANAYTSVELTWPLPRKNRKKSQAGSFRMGRFDI